MTNRFTQSAIPVTRACHISFLRWLAAKALSRCDWDPAPELYFALPIMMSAQAWAGVSALATCFVFCSLSAAQQTSTHDTGSFHATPDTPIHFELLAQPLDKALQAYGRSTRLLIMADSGLLSERTSAPVIGDYSRQEGLRLMLAGTGLEAQFTDARSVIILPGSAAPAPSRDEAPPSSVAVSAADIDGLGDDASYVTLIQARLTEALCQSARTRPGDYRLVVQLRIDSSGSVAASKILDSTGDPARDTAIAQVVRTLVLDDGPPATLAQPVTILLRPQDGRVANGCVRFTSQG
jgi:hypothetical protein